MDYEEEIIDVLASIEVPRLPLPNEYGDEGDEEDDQGDRKTDNSPSVNIDGQSTNYLLPPNLYPSIYDGDGESSMNTTMGKSPRKFQSPGASSGPICRICHEGDNKEDLVSPCRCAGTLALVHRSCMEKWLSTRVNEVDKCEICNYNFVTTRSPKSFIQFIRCDANNGGNRQSLCGDLTCFVLLTPLAIFTTYLCIAGAKTQVSYNNSLEAGCLMALATFLSTVYLVWNVLTIRYHVRCFLKWRLKNTTVKLVKVQRVSTAFDETTGHSVTRLTQDDANHSPSVIIDIPEGVNVS